MKKYLLTLLLLCAIAASLCCYADTPPPPPVPYQIELADGELVFYMTPSDMVDETHRASGLYNGKEPYEQIYAIYDYIYAGELFLSADGMYCVEMPYWLVYGGVTTTGNNALVFYHEGRWMAYYGLHDVLPDDSSAYYSISHVQWDFQDQRSFDADTNILTAIARDGTELRFDITTGKLATETPEAAPEADDSNASLYIAALIALTVLVAILIATLKRKPTPDLQEKD